MATPLIFSINEQIGPYRLVRHLGSGAFGEVWQAERVAGLDIKVNVALKLQDSRQFPLEQIKHEVRVWSWVSDHPHILPLIGVEEYRVRGVNYVGIASQYVAGGSLADWLARQPHGVADCAAACRVVCGVLEALEYMHDWRDADTGKPAPIVHRDLKTANVLMNGEMPLVADLGLANIIEGSQDYRFTNHLGGTLSYMSPEALDGRISPRQDIWAAGVMLYKLLSGRVPFDKTERSALIKAIVLDPVPPLPSAVPDTARQIVARALQKEEGQRYQTAAAMRQDLMSFLAGYSLADWEKTLPDYEFQQRELEKRLAAEEAARLRAVAAERDKKQPVPIPVPIKRLWPKVVASSAAVLLSAVVLYYKLIGGGTLPPVGAISPTDARSTVVISNDYVAYLPNAIKLEMVPIPAGSSRMGEDAVALVIIRLARVLEAAGGLEATKICSQQCLECKGCDFSSFGSGAEEHEVSVPAMYLGRYEVTQEQWQAVMGNNPSRFQGCPKCPVENVSWNEAKGFVKRLNSLQNKYLYRLPSEAEWEYAARAGTKTAFAFGDALTSEQANFDGRYPYGNSAKGNYLEKTRAVGSYPANSFGLYDMHGNVWEWCEDIYSKTYAGLPKDGSANAIIGEDISLRILRGGSWDDAGIAVRSAARIGASLSAHSSIFGVRLAASAK